MTDHPPGINPDEPSEFHYRERTMITAEQTATKPKKPRLRSPAYPAINLETAVKRAEDFKEFANQTAVTITYVLEHWGYTGGSSEGMKVVAALGYYGLAKDSGSGERRRIQLTDRALRILVDHKGSLAREQAIKDAALSPAIYLDMWKKWGDQLPPDAEIMSYLLLDRKFNEKAVSDLIADYKTTIKYAKLTASDTIIESETGGGESEANPSFTILPPKARVPPRKMETGMNEEVFTIGGKQALLQWPDRITEEDYEDFAAWMNLIIKKAKRSIVHDDKQDEDREADT